jgi:ubiquinone/menaquinone biosynthesis C-methylase UbiE
MLTSADHQASEFESYLEQEWMLFERDPVRQQEAARAVAGIDVRAVLDVGCGGGQDLVPFALRGARCAGIDVSHASGVWGSRQFASTYPGTTVRFLTAAAEHLPFADGSFDVVLCRVAIPYTDNHAALAEIGRVLRPGGALLLKTHTPRYYVKKFLDGIRQRAPLFSVHALRVLASGTLYHLTGQQPRGGLLLRESYQSDRLLNRELASAGMRIAGELADSNPLTRSYRIDRLPP